jgi:hypothetical protein
MTKLPYKKRDIAVKQLEIAISLYQERHDPFSVITLAGAAEEILGQYVKASGRTNSLEVLNNAALAIQRIEGNEKPVNVIDRTNYARNNLKHLDGPEDCISIDAWQEAKDMLIRATDNCWLLDECSSPLIVNFLKQVRID